MAYGKNYSNLAKMFVLWQFKIAANQTDCSRLEQRFVIKFMLAEKCKSCEDYGRMCYVHGETYFSQKNYLQTG